MGIVWKSTTKCYISEREKGAHVTDMHIVTDMHLVTDMHIVTDKHIVSSERR